MELFKVMILFQEKKIDQLLQYVEWSIDNQLLDKDTGKLNFPKDN